MWIESAAVTICTGHGRQAQLPEKQWQIKLENRGKIDDTDQFIKASMRSQQGRAGRKNM